MDRYGDYKDIFFGNRKRNSRLLEDFDNDGANNLTEWILGSDGSNPEALPEEPKPVFSTTSTTVITTEFTRFIRIVSKFGFSFRKKLGTIPEVTYQLQLSTDGGLVWTDLPDGDYFNASGPTWQVRTVLTTENTTPVETVEVNSLFEDPISFIPAQPPGTQNDRFRFKVSRR
ncbi:MAG: hypothetical protein HC845_04495 [Akkermansiaceae bacterium]|nr:hypothetical protein [Akkermansiaceae bacterium]